MTDLAFVTWSDSSTDREDPGYYDPSVLDLEERIAGAGAFRLGELVETMDRLVKPEGAGTITYIDIAAVNARTGDIIPSEIQASEAPSRARKLVSSGDILISSVRPERNAVARVPPELDGAVASTGFFVVHPLPAWRDRSDRLFLYLKTEPFIRQAGRRCTSSMYPVLNETDLLTILVPKIVLEGAGSAQAALQSADAARRHAEAELSRARTLLTDLVSAITEDPDPRPL